MNTDRYTGSSLAHVSFPMGGMGAGMLCLDGGGALSKFSLRHRPDLVTERRVFAAISVGGASRIARVLEGPVATWKLRPQFPGKWGAPPNATWGLPRFREATFEARFPFATVRLHDDAVPLDVELTGWSPFFPGDADAASLPVAALEYRFVNRSQQPIDAFFSFNTENFMAAGAVSSDSNSRPADRIGSIPGGIVLHDFGSEACPWREGHFAVWLEESDAKVNHVWFRGSSVDQMQMVWKDIETGRCSTRGPDPDMPSPGASIFLPFQVAAGGSRTIRLLLAWYVPKSDLFEPSFRSKGGNLEPVASSAETYRPWYAGRFQGIDEVRNYWSTHYPSLHQATQQFSDTFYDSTLPPEIVEAVAANLSILKSPTILRQIDGRLWGWEGSYDEAGSCYGSSNHVWNYAQSIAHLFPALERSLRETELGPNLGEDGFQAIRAALPIRSVGDTREDGFGHSAAADGQLGGIIKVYRDWRISGDTEWLRGLWRSIRTSLDYCIRTWDPAHEGAISEPHLNTYDVEFWGADSLCTSVYLGALKAAILMGGALGENVNHYSALFVKGVSQIEGTLFNGEYFFQLTQWTNLRAVFPPTDGGPVAMAVSQYPEMLELARKEGPPYQYGRGCLSDGVFGAWLCLVSGVPEILDRRKVESHLTAVHRNNLIKRLIEYPNHLRSFLGCGEESGLLLCSWPKGGRPSSPFMYADEVWTGIEYQVASHLIALKRIDEGLEIIRSCRHRYDGRVRNPFAEAEAGHWYARAMSSYALLQAFSGARFDAVDQILHLEPAVKGDFRCFLSTATGYGTVGVRHGKPFLEIVSGEIPYREINYAPA